MMNNLVRQIQNGEILLGFFYFWRCIDLCKKQKTKTGTHSYLSKLPMKSLTELNVITSVMKEMRKRHTWKSMQWGNSGTTEALVSFMMTPPSRPNHASPPDSNTWWTELQCINTQGTQTFSLEPLPDQDLLSTSSVFPNTTQEKQKIKLKTSYHTLN